MARGKSHDEDVKARALAGLYAGLSVSEIARMLGLNESSVRNWKNELSDQDLAKVSEGRAARLETLTFGYLEQLLVSLTSQAKVAGDASYIKNQSANSLTVLHGKLADTAFRILAAVPGNIKPEPEQCRDASDGD